LFRPATGIFIKPHPGSISIWGKTIPQKDKAVVRPESNSDMHFYCMNYSALVQQIPGFLNLPR
jgi:hypothetical protein